MDTAAEAAEGELPLRGMFLNLAEALKLMAEPDTKMAERGPFILNPRFKKTEI